MHASAQNTGGSEKRARAAAVLASGRSPTETAREVGVDTSTLRRWRQRYPEIFRKAETSDEIYRETLKAALSAVKPDGSPDHERRTKAAKELRDLDAQRSKVNAPGRVTIYATGPISCPHCHGSLVEHAEYEVVRDGDNDV